MDAATEVTPPEFDISAAVSTIAEDLRLSPEEEKAPPPPAEKPEAASPSPPAAGEASPPVEGKPTEPEKAEEKPAAEKETKSAAETPPTDRVPDTWRKEAKEAYAALPEVVKAEIQKREGDIAKFVSEAKPYVQAGDAFLKVVQPYMPVFQRFNIRPDEHVKNLLGAHSLLMFGNAEQKTGMIRQIAKEAGVDLAKVAEGQENAVNEHASQVIANLMTRIAQLEQGVTGVTNSVKEAQINELQTSIQAFGQDTEAHPYFWDVMDRMTELINSGAATSLERAYNLAVMDDPIIRQKILDSEAEKRAASKAATEAARAAEASKAASANVKSSGKGRAATTETLDDTLWSALQDIKSREH